MHDTLPRDYVKKLTKYLKKFIINKMKCLRCKKDKDESEFSKTKSGKMKRGCDQCLERARKSKAGEKRQKLTEQQKKENLAKANRLYYQTSKARRFVRCECGSLIQKYSKKSHCQTQRHKFLLQHKNEILS